eukprot:CAMPEP_0170136268 /NCGR_PEP_ID=MMETSP0033_2-20121228/3146_1 /TAXON_ID=195969 /ORGANISM="Dolichomastix tenuilepis, Strain CCMP3274" /LENGTH=130 /DNA_ID=CAMNT_0010371961 /DNA_START=468 /DNA_END=856 /DNA_ORIENTATION=+
MDEPNDDVGQITCNLPEGKYASRREIQERIASARDEGLLYARGELHNEVAPMMFRRPSGLEVAWRFGYVCDGIIYYFNGFKKPPPPPAPPPAPPRGRRPAPFPEKKKEYELTPIAVLPCTTCRQALRWTT